MIDTRCAAWRAGMAGATQPGTRAGRRPGAVGALVAALIAASTGVAATFLAGAALVAIPLCLCWFAPRPTVSRS